MDYLWTPWRMAYIRSDKKPAEGCVFCKLAAAQDDNNQVIARSAFVYVTLNLYPYNNGHLMVIPNQHTGTPENLPTDVLADLMQTTNRALAVLREAYNPPAFNLGANIGPAAGAGIAEHYHFHIVPRWPGDANFMTTVGHTRVIPDTLENIYHELKAIWHRLYPEGV
ncbi:MAG: HIT domain-containing protein [Chloroflexi bacterium]|nr:HIT domain-containing protein [Chloroflexota bacterium]